MIDFNIILFHTYSSSLRNVPFTALLALQFKQLLTSLRQNLSQISDLTICRGSPILFENEFSDSFHCSKVNYISKRIIRVTVNVVSIGLDIYPVFVKSLGWIPRSFIATSLLKFLLPPITHICTIVFIVTLSCLSLSNLILSNLMLFSLLIYKYMLLIYFQ